LSGIQLIAGLANPGKEYAQTRHNAGAWFIDAITQLMNVNLRAERKFHGLFASGELAQHACQLLVPTTYMNHSGKAVSACAQYFKLKPAAILIAHDELDLPVGTIKLKYDGGDGGHNGLKDIIAQLHTKQFYRLRIGIGRPRKEVIDYVLEPPSKLERQTINAAITKALDILPLLMAGKMQIAMQNLHTQSGVDENGT
jgi:PTH1 family peptidyl-tRNA hydrolase